MDARAIAQQRDSSKPSTQRGELSAITIAELFANRRNQSCNSTIHLVYDPWWAHAYWHGPVFGEYSELQTVLLAHARQ